MPDTVLSPELGSLPQWDLRDLYPAPDAPELTADLARADQDAKALEADYQGKLDGLDGPAFAEAIRRYEALDELLGRIMSYGQLVYAGDIADPEIGRFYQTLQEKVTDISTHILFFTLELNRIDDAVLEAKLSHGPANRYRPWIAASRAFRPHQLEDTTEKLLHEKYVTGRGAWTRLFDETMAALRVDYRGQKLTSTEALNLMVDKDGDVRRDAAQGFGRALAGEVRTFALITNTLIKDKEIDDRWRKYPRSISARNLANRVEDEVVDALVAAVRQAYPKLSHRYYQLKAKWFGQDKLDWWDRNAPLPDAPDRILRWEEARDTVLGAYASFSPDLADLGRKFFDNAWIDAPVRPGKSPGAFAHPTVPSAHPYLLVNYQGKVRDVMTLAHELGHGVHQLLAGSTQGHLLADTPLTLAETASVFGEMLTFQALLKAESDPRRRRLMLASKVEDMLNTVVRQIAFHGFEEKLHAERRQGEISADRIAELWMETQSESLGPAFRFDDDYHHVWAYIGHFVHSPFYVYAYAYGDCLVNSLYAAYQKAPDGFDGRYLELLRAGGSQHHSQLRAPFGLNAADPAFWSQGLGVIAGFIDQLEQEG